VVEFVTLLSLIEPERIPISLLALLFTHKDKAYDVISVWSEYCILVRKKETGVDDMY
jgi:hypothetical protein